MCRCTPYNFLVGSPSNRVSTSQLSIAIVCICDHDGSSPGALGPILDGKPLTDQVADRPEVWKSRIDEYHDDTSVMMLSRTRHLAATDLDQTDVRSTYRQTGHHTKQILMKSKALGTCRRVGRSGECRALRRPCPWSTKRKTALRSAQFGPNRTSDGINAIEKARSNACSCLTNNRGETETSTTSPATSGVSGCPSPVVIDKCL